MIKKVDGASLDEIVDILGSMADLGYSKDLTAVESGGLSNNAPDEEVMTRSRINRYVFGDTKYFYIHRDLRWSLVGGNECVSLKLELLLVKEETFYKTCLARIANIITSISHGTMKKGRPKNGL